MTTIRELLAARRDEGVTELARHMREAGAAHDPTEECPCCQQLASYIEDYRERIHLIDVNKPVSGWWEK